MQEQLGVMEGRFAELIWDLAPIRTSDLAALCQAQLGWKRTTMYTMLKRLCQRGIVENDSGTVVVRMPREEFHSRQSRQFVSEAFGGSLPAFIAAFTRHQNLSDKDADEIQRLIDESRKRSGAGEAVHSPVSGTHRDDSIDTHER